MHWYKHSRNVPAISNPSINLGVACQKLRKLDMTSHLVKLTDNTLENNWVTTPKPVQELIDTSRLDTNFDCVSLEEVYIDGLYAGRGGESKDLDSLEGIAK